MPAAALPHNEDERLEALQAYHILDTAGERDFDELTELASAICQTPIALISLVDKDRQWFKSHKGLPVTETEREFSFCAHAINNPTDILIVDDPKTDPRFADNPLVTGPTNINFYAGVPLVDDEGFALGSLCVIDNHKHTELTEQQVNALRILGWQVIDKLRLRKQNAELRELNEKLRQSEQTIRELSENRPQDVVQSEARFRNLMQNAPVAMAVLTSRNMVVDLANEQMLLVWGRDTAVIGKPLEEALPELKGQPFLQLLDEVFTTGKAVEGREAKAFLEHNGVLEEAYFNYIYQPIIDENGKVTGVLDIAYEVTELVKSKNLVQQLNTELAAANEVLEDKVAERTRELSESEERFRIMAEGTDVMIAVGDETGAAVYFNEAWSRVTGRSTEDLLKFGWVDLMHPEDVDRVMNIFKKAFEKHAAWEWEFRMPDNDGDYKWLLARGTPRVLPDGSFTGYISATIDITERKKDDQRKNDFIGMVSHELKTPITSLSGYLQIMQMKARKAEDEAALNTLERAAKQVGKMTTMINGFLNVSRLESGKIHIDKQPFDMAELVKEAEEESLASISSHKVVFAPVEPTNVIADRDKIGQVITNLISNAVKYSPPGSTINVACVTINDLATVSVKDEGIGIATDDLKQLFDRYYRVESQATKSISGFGIGLYLCKEIVERHKGTIAAKSEPGKGSTFYFTLPVVQ